MANFVKLDTTILNLDSVARIELDEEKRDRPPRIHILFNNGEKDSIDDPECPKEGCYWDLINKKLKLWDQYD